MSLTVSVMIAMVLFLVIAYLVYRIRKKHQGLFKIVIANGIITSRTETVPAEFLYDVQQIARIEKIEQLVINGIGIKTSSPQLIFNGILSQRLREKFQQSLTLSLQ